MSARGDHRKAQSPEPGPAVDNRLLLAAEAVLVLSLFLAYSNSFQGAFIFDDVSYIVDNRDIRQFSTLLPAIYPSEGGATAAGRPLVCVSLMLNYWISGTEVWSYHVFNLTVHVLATLLLFGVVRRTLLLPKFRAGLGDRSTPLALACALLWGLHPLQTESVTYVIQRAESLVSLFYLLTLYCVIRGEQSPQGRRWFTAAVLSCTMGMMAKEVMVTAPVLILLYERVFVFDSWKELLRQRRGLLASLAATWLLLPALVLPLKGRGGTAGFGLSITPWQYLLTQFVAICTYLKLMFVPSPLILDYGRYLEGDLGWVAPAAILVCSLAVATLLAFRYQPWIGYLGAWFFVILSPSSSVVPIVTQTIAEHRVYLPLAGPIVLVVMVGDWCWRRLLARLPGRQREAALIRGTPAAVVIAIAVLFGSLTWLRNVDYRTPLSLWTDTVAKRPGNMRAHAQLGDALAEAGDPLAGLREHTYCIEKEPRIATHYVHRGTVHLDLGNLEEAFTDFSQSLQLKRTPEALANRGLVYCRRREFEPAIVDFDEALQLDPNMLLAYRNRALSHFYLQHFDLARRDIQAFRARGGSPDQDLLIVEDFLNRQ